MDEHDEMIRNMIGDGPTEEEERERKKAMSTEEALRDFIQSDRMVDLIIDLIAERSEEKAQEVLEEHKLDYDHDQLYQ